MMTEFAKQFGFEYKGMVEGYQDGFYIEGNYSINGKKITSAKIYNDFINFGESAAKAEEVFICKVLVGEDCHQSKNCRELYSCFIWLSKLLDERPILFHKYDLQLEKAKRSADTSILSEGAEYYVMSYLMLHHGLICSQVSRAMPGYDILVTHPSIPGKNAKIQVKFNSGLPLPFNSSREKYRGRAINVSSLDFDFLIVVSNSRNFTEEAGFYKTSRSHYDTTVVTTTYKLTKEKIDHRHPCCWIMSHDAVEFGIPYLTDDCYNRWEKIMRYFATNDSGAAQPFLENSTVNK